MGFTPQSALSGRTGIGGLGTVRGTGRLGRGVLDMERERKKVTWTRKESGMHGFWGSEKEREWQDV